MKRHLLIIAICLLLGAVVNVAVAWGCAVFAVDTAWFRSLQSVEGATSNGEYIRAENFSKLGATLLYLTRARGAGTPPSIESLPLPGWSHLSTPTRAYRTGERDSESRWNNGFGWPMRSMWYELDVRYVYVIKDIAGGIPVSQIRLRSEEESFAYPVLPLYVIWLGFVINTIFYATVLWLLIPGPFVLRRFLRVRRGLCPKCAYRMGESSVCTECGKSLASWRWRGGAGCALIPLMLGVMTSSIT